MSSAKKLIKQVSRNDASLSSLTLIDVVAQADLRALSESLQSNEFVTSLKILISNASGVVPAADEEAWTAGSAVAEALQFNTTLQRITLDSMRVSGDDVAQLSASLATNELAVVRELSLVDNPIEAHGLIAFSAMLATNCTLRKLSLAGNELLDSATVQHVARALSVNSTLEELDLWKPTPFNDTVTMVMARALKTNRALRWLRFNAATSSADVIESFTDEIRLHNFVLAHVDAFAYSTDELDAVLKRNKSLHWPVLRSFLLSISIVLWQVLPSAAVLEAIVDMLNPSIAERPELAPRIARALKHIVAFSPSQLAAANAVAPAVDLIAD